MTRLGGSQSKVVAKTHDNDNDLYDKYTRVSTGLIIPLRYSRKVVYNIKSSKIFNLGTDKNIAYLPVLSLMCAQQKIALVGRRIDSRWAFRAPRIALKQSPHFRKLPSFFLVSGNWRLGDGEGASICEFSFGYSWAGARAPSGPPPPGARCLALLPPGLVAVPPSSSAWR